MEAKELRIGNYHYYHVVDNLDERKEWDEICQIDADDFKSISESYKPIPIIEEWLIKLGFEKKGSFYRIENSRFVEVIIHDDGIDVCNHSVYLPHIKYAHQLQNLYFALTNQELTIK
jgi:hypothetical protein